MDDFKKVIRRTSRTVVCQSTKYFNCFCTNLRSKGNKQEELNS